MHLVQRSANVRGTKITEANWSHRTGQRLAFAVLASVICPLRLAGQDLPLVSNVRQQPMAAQAIRLIETMNYLGAPLASHDQEALRLASEEKDEEKAVEHIQGILDKYALIGVRIDAESRVKVSRGPARAELVEQGWRPFLVKVNNQAGVTAELKVESPQAGPVYVPSSGSPSPKQTLKLSDAKYRWLDLSLYNRPPMQPQLSGLELEYVVLLVFGRDAGKYEAKISFNVGQGTQDIGFRNDVNIVFNCLPAVDVKLRILDPNRRPATSSLIFRDTNGHIYPEQVKRLAPDFFFQPQVYREDGETIKLPPGRYEVEFTRGPEYLTETRSVEITSGKSQPVTFQLKSWIDPARLGWYSGDHHIHAAGCAHYEDPTQGVFPQDMIRDIKGEGLNVGNVLTWGPCFYFQKQFFEGQGKVHELSTPENLMRYDVEVSGFPSSHCGHLVLMNLRQQDYPGTKKIEDWPSWDFPILKWARDQGAVVGFAHSGWGLALNSNALPNYQIPPFDGIGANEYIVDVTFPKTVDFISAGDTPAPWELNIWYHALNCGFRTKISGETDFPCIYDKRVGMGRVYVKEDGKLDYVSWVEGVRAGRSYVSDGRSHLMDFKVNGVLVGTRDSEVRLMSPDKVHVTARVAARLEEQPNEAIRGLPFDQKPYWDLERARLSGTRQVPLEVVLNGYPVAVKNVLADGSLRDVSFDIPIERSSWLALRIMYSSSTNPIFVLVNDQPIRASRRSAEWCLKAVDQCWSQKVSQISEKERPEAERAFEHARQVYRQILSESRVQ